MSDWASQGRVGGDFKRYFKYPDYEIWKYLDVPTPDGRNLLFLFGNDGETGEFRMIGSLEEMIPNKAYRAPNTPSYLLQMWLYYSMAGFDGYFSKTFNSMRERLFQSDMRGSYGINQQESRALKGQHESILFHTQMGAPPQVSSFGDELPTMPVQVRQYRLLDEQIQPYPATFLFANPYEAFFLDQEAGGLTLSAYDLIGSAIGVDEQRQVRFRERTSAVPLSEIKEYEGSIFEMPPEQLYLQVPSDSAASQKFTVELRSTRADTAGQEGIFQNQIRGLGETTTGQQPIMEPGEDQLQMGDLILCIHRNEADGELPFGFRVQPETKIPQGQNLIVHVEVYHLSGPQDGINPFQLEYEVTKKSGLLKRLFGNNEKVKLTLNFQAEGTSFRENLEIETAPFGDGKYTLHLTARNTETGRSTSREIEFVVEGENDY